MDMQTGSINSLDGTRLTTYTTGPADAPAMVLCNGLGGSVVAWRQLVAHFEDRFRIWSWDYRGTYRSDPPAHRNDEDFDMSRQCEDLDAVLAAAKVDSAIFVGWSMGVQLAFEYYRKSPQRFAALIQLNGTPGRPIDTAFRSRWTRPVFPFLLDAAQHLEPVLSLSEPLLSSTRMLITLFKTLGFVSPMLDEVIFQEIIRDYLHLDFDCYGKTFRALARHDASDVLSTVAVPALLIAGDKDMFTPPEITREMAMKIPGAEHLIIHGGTHYTPIEYPMVVNLRIEKFLRERLDLR